MAHFLLGEGHGPQESLGDSHQRVLWPSREPVDGAAIDQGREEEEPLPEGVSDRSGLAELLLCERSDAFADGHLFVVREDVGDLAVVEHVVDVLDEHLLLDLGVAEEEHQRLRPRPRGDQDPLQVLAPLRHVVALADLNLNHARTRHVRRQACQRLPAGTSNAHQESVPSRHLQHAADPAHVLDGEHEHDEVHGLAAHAVEILQVAFDAFLQNLAIFHFLVGTILDLWFSEVVTEEQHSEVVSRHVPPLVTLQMREHVREANLEVFGHHLLQVSVEPVAVSVVDQPIAEHAKRLVAPQPRKLPFPEGIRRRHHQHALDDAAEVPQVEDVVALLGRRKQLLHHLPVRVQSRSDDALLCAHCISSEGPVPHEPLDNRSEDPRQRVVVEGVETQEIEVAKHPRCDVISAPSRRAHRGDHSRVDDAAPAHLLKVVPSLAIDQLPEKLDGRLRAVLLHLGHVQVVDKDDRTLAHGRAVHALSALV
eukprot:scaffold2923_cov313-Pinguiococcus_pyrenoidosus.AAC.4